MFPTMLKNLLLVQSFGIQNRPFKHCNGDDDGSSLAAKLRHVRAYVTQPLNHYALAIDSGSEAQRPHFLGLGASFSEGVEQSTSGGLAPAPDASLRYRLAGNAGRGVQAPGIERRGCRLSPAACGDYARHARPESPQHRPRVETAEIQTGRRCCNA